MRTIDASAEEAVLEMLQKAGPCLWTISSCNFQILAGARCFSPSIGWQGRAYYCFAASLAQPIKSPFLATYVNPVIPSPNYPGYGEDLGN